MRRIHLLALTVLALLGLCPIPALHAQIISVKVTDLGNGGYTYPSAYGVSGNTQVGAGTNPDAVWSHALLWHGTSSAIDLTPFGYDYSYASGVSGSTQVGYGVTSPDSNNRYSIYALLWKGSAASAINLNPVGSTDSYATAVSGGSQVGYGVFFSDPNGLPFHALLWHGTAASAIDLNPAGYNSYATGVSGDTQVGHGNGHALLWHGTAASAVDLTPSGYDGAEALAVSGNTQVGDGSGTATGGGTHALLWHGTAASAVDLTPINIDPYDDSYATGVSGNVQVGYREVPDDNDLSVFHDRAMLWSGTGASAVDISTYLPKGFNTDSQAFSVDNTGSVVNVAGYGKGTSGQHAFLWHITFGATNPKPIISSLSPSSKAARSSAFTLTVSGTGFASNSLVKWNGTEQMTAYVSSTKLTASIPASLITTVGTASVTVVTPHVATSNSKTFTIHPAAVTLSSLSFSPVTVKGGSANTTGTITLTAPAPSGGTVVALSSNNGAITFPASTVTIPAGATSATFRAYSHTVTSTKTVTVTATYAGASKTATVTVTP